MAGTLEDNSQSFKQKVRPTQELHQEEIYRYTSHRDKKCSQQGVQLQKSNNIHIHHPTKNERHKKSKRCKNLLDRRLALWENQEYTSLVNTAVSASNTYKISTHLNKWPDHVARVFQCLLLQGKIREATNYVINSSSKGVRLADPETINPKTELRVIVIIYSQLCGHRYAKAIY